MLNSKKITISNYAELNDKLEETKNTLTNKIKESNWLRYAFRRIPLYSGIGFIFFAVCLAMSMSEKIGLDTINDKFLKQDLSFDIKWSGWLFLAGLIFLLEESLRYQYINNHKTLSLHYKVIIHVLLLTILVSGLLIVFSSQYPLLLGVAAFSVITLSSIFTDRTLGFTRRNERYKLFWHKANNLQILFASREKLKIPFTETHLLELARFFEELQKSKHNETISDSNYLLYLLEKAKSESK